MIINDDVRVLLVPDIHTISVADDYTVPSISLLNIFFIHTIFNSKHFQCIFIIFPTSNFLPYFSIFLQSIFFPTYYFSHTMTFGIHLLVAAEKKIRNKKRICCYSCCCTQFCYYSCCDEIILLLYMLQLLLRFVFVNFQSIFCYAPEIMLCRL